MACEWDLIFPIGQDLTDQFPNEPLLKLSLMVAFCLGGFVAL